MPSLLPRHLPLPFAPWQVVQTLPLPGPSSPIILTSHPQHPSPFPSFPFALWQVVQTFPHPSPSYPIILTSHPFHPYPFPSFPIPSPPPLRTMASGASVTPSFPHPHPCPIPHIPSSLPVTPIPKSPFPSYTQTLHISVPFLPPPLLLQRLDFTALQEGDCKKTYAPPCALNLAARRRGKEGGMQEDNATGEMEKKKRGREERRIEAIVEIAKGDIGLLSLTSPSTLLPPLPASLPPLAFITPGGGL